MFSDNDNLIKTSNVFSIEKHYFNISKSYKITLTTHGIKNFEKMKLLIDCVSSTLKFRTSYLRIYRNTLSVYEGYQITNIFSINDKLIIEFRIFNADENDDFDLDCITDWAVLIFDDTETDGKYIYGLSLIN